MNYYSYCLKHYADFKSRARRKEYWMFALCNAIISWLLIMIEYLAFSEDVLRQIFNQIYSLAVFIPSLAVYVRRLHDTNRSGWWALIVLIPIIGWIWGFVLTVLDGDKGSNEYGNDPKAAVEE